MIKSVLFYLSAILLTVHATSIGQTRVGERRVSFSLRQEQPAYVVGRFMNTRGNRRMNGWYAIRQDYLVDSNSPATSITVFLRLTGLEKSTAYDMELGVDSGFKIVGCIQSAAWASKDTFEFTTDADLRTNYELV